MRESCLVYCYSGIQSLFEVVLLYTFYIGGLYVRRLDFKPVHVAISERSHVAVEISSKATDIAIGNV